MEKTMGTRWEGALEKYPYFSPVGKKNSAASIPKGQRVTQWMALHLTGSVVS